MTKAAEKPHPSSIDADEVAKFAAMAEEWWDPDGKFRPLHKFNPVRLDWLVGEITRHFGRDRKADRPLAGLTVLDIGCGGGLLSEPMARLGATVTGADAGEKNIAIARAHAEGTGLAIDYRATTAEALAAEGAAFDSVLNMEVVEHVADPAAFLADCARLVKPGGVMFVATINRTWKALALAKIGAEYILRWLPVGTHEVAKFLRPNEIRDPLMAAGLKVHAPVGVAYNPLADRFHLTTDTAVNYMLMAEKPAG
jgi:2-polyprenyl-6-hydroxyphenyl methylase/3-demethylubiquinone-9 3-methyltransferase